MPWDSVDSLVCIINNVTANYNLMSLKIADKNKDKVISTISHELRTPINGIFGLIEMIEDKANK